MTSYSHSIVTLVSSSTRMRVPVENRLAWGDTLIITTTSLYCRKLVFGPPFGRSVFCWNHTTMWRTDR